MVKTRAATPQKKESKWVTMAEVAARAQVAKITVSRVLRHPEKVRPETRKRVMTAVEELGYVPDEIAGGFSSGRSGVVGALISTLEGSTFASTVDGLSQTLREAGLHLLLATTDYSAKTEEEILPALLGRRPDAVVLTSFAHTRLTRKRLQDASIPVVELWDLPARPLDSAVGFSNFDAGRDMTRHLIGQGRSKIAFIGTQQDIDNRSMRRADGYAAAMNEIPRSQPYTVYDKQGESAVTSGARGFAAIVENGMKCDAVFCVSDAVALGVLMEAKRLGVKVPDDIAVAGFGDFEFSGEDGLQLTTVRIPGLRIGTEAAHIVLDRLQGHETKRRKVDVGYEIVERKTT